MNEYFKEVRRLADMEQGVLAQKDANDARSKELATAAEKLSKALEDFKYAKLKDNQDLMKKYGMLQDVMNNEKKQFSGLLTQVKIATTALQHEIGNARQERVKTETAQKLAERAREKVKNEEEKEKRRSEAANLRSQRESEAADRRRKNESDVADRRKEAERRRSLAESDRKSRENQAEQKRKDDEHNRRIDARQKEREKRADEYNERRRKYLEKNGRRH